MVGNGGHGYGEEAMQIEEKTRHKKYEKWKKSVKEEAITKGV